VPGYPSLNRLRFWCTGMMLFMQQYQRTHIPFRIYLSHCLTVEPVAVNHVRNQFLAVCD
jgi:hypothetical protein